MLIKIITSVITQNNDERKTKGLLITLWDAKIFRYNTHKLNMGFAVFFFFFLQSITEEMMVSFKSLGISRFQRNRNMTDPLRNDDPGETNDIFQLNYSQMCGKEINKMKNKSSPLVLQLYLLI